MRNRQFLAQRPLSHSYVRLSPHCRISHSGGRGTPTSLAIRLMDAQHDKSRLAPMNGLVSMRFGANSPERLIDDLHSSIVFQEDWWRARARHRDVSDRIGAEQELAQVGHLSDDGWVAIDRRSQTQHVVHFRRADLVHKHRLSHRIEQAAYVERRDRGR
jgi:hypothetical protein